MKAKRFKAFTLAELITVVVIIALLLGVLVPALSQVKKIALEAKQKAQIAGIEVGLGMYKNDFGSYPPSHGSNDPAESTPTHFSYCGAQTLTEAMFGQDLLGYNPDSNYTNEGIDNTIPKTLANRHYVYDTMTPTERDISLGKRKDPYLDRTNIGVFTPRQIFDTDTYSFNLKVVSDRYVICDVFTAVSRNISGKQYKIGTPVLYFQANLSPGFTESTPRPLPDDLKDNIYNWRDNYNLMSRYFGRITDNIEHPIWTTNGDIFYNYIRDSMIPIIDTANTCGTPVRKDSFLLISAGFDGLYGTGDDICNFTPNLP